MLRILEEIFQLLTHLLTQLSENTMTLVQSHALNDVSALVGCETRQYFSDTFRFEVFKYRRTTPHRRLIAQLYCPSDRQHRKNRGRLDNCQLIQQLCEIGWSHVSDLTT